MGAPSPSQDSCLRDSVTSREPQVAGMLDSSRRRALRSGLLVLFHVLFGRGAELSAGAGGCLRGERQPGGGQASGKLRVILL